MSSHLVNQRRFDARSDEDLRDLAYFIRHAELFGMDYQVHGESEWPYIIAVDWGRP